MITVDHQPVYPGDGNAPSLYAVGWGLARTARFAGQTQRWYPVLPHIYVVATLVPEEFEVEALLHDAAEAVLGDVVATWKNQQTKDDEAEILGLMYQSLGLKDRPEYHHKFGVTMSDEVRTADLAARSAEAKLLGHSEPDADFWQEIRMVAPEMYERALDLTTVCMENFTPEYCIHETDLLARLYAECVTKAINKVTA